MLARKRDANGRPVGKRNANPILDTREYEVEFSDGASDMFVVNVITENLYSQIDNEGNSYSIFQEIMDHKSDGMAVQADAT